MSKHTPGPFLRIVYRNGEDTTLPPSQMTATLLKHVGGKIIFRVHARPTAVADVFYVWHSNNAGTSWPWRVSTTRVVGSLGAYEADEDLDEFKTFREAMSEARRFARASLDHVRGTKARGGK